MGTIELAIDLGTTYTTVYQRGVGVLLREPSVVAVERSATAMSIRASGTEAKKMSAQHVDGVEILYPMVEGMIDDADAAKMMLSDFLARALPESLFRRKIKILGAVPCGMTKEEYGRFENLFFDVGASEVVLLPTAVLAAMDFSMGDGPLEGRFVVDIGGGKTDIALVSPRGMITGCTLGIGGRNVDVAIIESLQRFSDAQIGILTAEQLKCNVASLFENDSTALRIYARDIPTGQPKSMNVTAKDLLISVGSLYSKIIEVVKEVLSCFPEELIDVVNRAGIYVCGGSSLMPGLEKAFSSHFNCPITMVNEPEKAVIYGAGRVLENDELFRTLVENEKLN